MKRINRLNRSIQIAQQPVKENNDFTIRNFIFPLSVSVPNCKFVLRRCTIVKYSVLWIFFCAGRKWWVGEWKELFFFSHYYHKICMKSSIFGWKKTFKISHFHQKEWKLLKLWKESCTFLRSNHERKVRIHEWRKSTKIVFNWVPSMMFVSASFFLSYDPFPFLVIIHHNPFRKQPPSDLESIKFVVKCECWSFGRFAWKQQNSSRWWSFQSIVDMTKMENYFPNNHNVTHSWAPPNIWNVWMRFMFLQ